MRDLRNERAEVVRRLKQFNFDPVNAEGWLPGGTNAWPRIAEEIESSDVFVLLLGDTYGWMPSDGPQSEKSLSVTHLEFRHARALALPILPFFKRLPEDADRSSRDALQRDAFRREVESWSEGYIRGHFELAADLADSVGTAVVELISNTFLRQAIAARAGTVDRSVARFANTRPTVSTRANTPPPTDLVSAVKSKQVVLFAGSGISINAGFPSAAAFVERLQHDLRNAEVTYSATPTGLHLAGVASDFALYFGRERLARTVADLMQPPQGTSPTIAHRLSVHLFDTIVTTNYDGLFEAAAVAEDTRHSVIVDETDASTFLKTVERKVILKLHGSAHRPDSLILTEEDVFDFSARHRNAVSVAQILLRNSNLLMLGTSYRDPTVVSLIDGLEGPRQRWFIADTVQAVTRRRLEAKGIRWIESDANSLMEALSNV